MLVAIMEERVVFELSIIVQKITLKVSAFVPVLGKDYKKLLPIK